MITLAEVGLVEVLIVSGGGAGFCGGRWRWCYRYCGTSHTVTVGKGQAITDRSRGRLPRRRSQPLVEQGPVPYPATGTYVDAGTAPNGGVLSSITGTEVNYAAQGLARPRCLLNWVDGIDGVVVIRVPAALTEKVDPGKWITRSNYFAVVKNGVVTET